VGGQWKYLFRAIDKHGELIDFMLLDRRDAGAAYRFLGKALKTTRRWPPHSITTDKLGSYPKPFKGCNVRASSVTTRVIAARNI
jgi:transposase-like protein